MYLALNKDLEVVSNNLCKISEETSFLTGLNSTTAYLRSVNRSVVQYRVFFQCYNVEIFK